MSQKNLIVSLFLFLLFAFVFLVLVANQVVSIGQIVREINMLKADVWTMRGDVMTLQEHVTTLETDLSELQRNLDRQGESINELQQNVDKLAESMSYLQTDLSDLQDLADWEEQRIVELESVLTQDNALELTKPACCFVASLELPGGVYEAIFVAPNWAETDLSTLEYAELVDGAWQKFLDEVFASGKPALVWRCEKISPAVAECAVGALNILPFEGTPQEEDTSTSAAN